MKDLLLLPLVLLSFSVMANDHCILGSLLQESAEHEDTERGIDAESLLTGFGARYHYFRDEGLYFGASFAHLTGDLDICRLTQCISADASRTRFSGEIGLEFGQWIPFIGTSFSSWEAEAPSESDSDETWGLNAGVLLGLGAFNLRGALTHLDDSENRALSGALLYQTDNNFVFGTELGTLLDDEIDEFRISVHFGKIF